MTNRKTIATAVIGITLVLSGAAQAAHWDRPSCYIDVHSGCFVNTNQPCTDQEYQDFLDNCDATYPASTRQPSGSLVAPGKPAGLGLTTR